MAGTVVASTIDDGTVFRTSSTDPIRGYAKVWVFMTNNGSTITSQASFNVSSVSYSTTGQQNVNFSASLSDANWSFGGGTSGSGGWVMMSLIGASYSGAATVRTSSAARTATCGGGTTNVYDNNFMVFR